jgi:uncharacterized protein YdcH (DUF465 family)
MKEIDRLTEQHNRLHASVEKLEKEHTQFPQDSDISNKLSELKKKKLQVKDALNQEKNKSE